RAAGLRGLVGRIRDAIVWSKHLRRVLYPVDLAVFLAIRFYVATVRGRVLVTDRYFYDTLVDVADEGGGFWVRVLERLTPEPDIAVFLEVSPEESYARKGEYSVDYLARRSAAYRRIAPLVPSAVVLPNADLDATCRALERAVEQQHATLALRLLSDQGGAPPPGITVDWPLLLALAQQNGVLVRLAERLERGGLRPPAFFAAAAERERARAETARSVMRHIADRCARHG